MMKKAHAVAAYITLRKTVLDVSLTQAEAERIARKVWRYMRRDTFSGSVTFVTGSRHTRAEVLQNKLVLNYTNGLSALLADLAWFLIPYQQTRAWEAAKLKLLKVAIKRGWYAPREVEAQQPPEKPKATRLSKLEARIKRLKARLARWQRRERIAGNAVKRISKKLKAAERARIPAATADEFKPLTGDAT